MSNYLEQLFVYGSLRSGFKHPAYEYMSKYFTLVGEAKVKGLLYDMGNYPAAIATTSDNYIIGELYRINHKNELSWALEQLDEYEGVEGEDGQPPQYARTTVNVFINDSTEQAWIYWYCGIVDNQPLVASGDILHYIQQKSKL